MTFFKTASLTCVAGVVSYGHQWPFYFERITHIRDRDLLVGATQIFQHVLDEKGALGNIAFCIFTHMLAYMVSS